MRVDDDDDSEEVNIEEFREMLWNEELIPVKILLSYFKLYNVNIDWKAIYLTALFVHSKFILDNYADLILPIEETYNINNVVSDDNINVKLEYAKNYNK